MHFIIRDVVAPDLDAVLTLNQSETPHLGSVDLRKMQWFALHAAYFRVAVGDDRLAAFLVGLRPGTSYESPNYRWFCDHYDDFAYVDRVAVADFARRAGLASRLYDDFAATLPDTVEFMTCEVNIRPPNESSMEFHRRMGFRQVGTQSTEGGNKEVAMLAKTL
ncbi:MAG: GNAT family N-acetyltransferase [Gammaproteobacteria bacterium]|nr:GNAT family N-acetyltransferase [Gammaproteobacteria bacterium]MDH3553512.1 GNAT family N-acetyltransferase [Gammaproteobacteria bacterium]